MIKNLHKFIVVLLLACSILLLYLTIANWSNIKPILGVYKEAIFSVIDIDYIAARTELAAMVKNNTSNSVNETIDYTRNLVYKNSIKQMDQEHDSYAFNKQAVTKKLWQAIAGEAKPHLSGGPRAYAMKDILSELNIQSRVVDVIYNDGLKSHTVLEVYNQERYQWQTHDPDNNALFLDKNNNRLSSINILTRSNSGIFNKQPVAVIIRESYDGKQNSLFYNPKRFILKEKLEEFQQGLNTVISKKYNKPTIFLLTDETQKTY